jgi:uncharacterized protein
MTMSTPGDIVTGVNTYPVKACQAATIEGERTSSLEVGAYGFEVGKVGDRDWLIADEAGFYVSQRGWNANKATKYPSDRLLASVSVDIRQDHLLLTSPGRGSLEIPTLPSGETESRVVGIHDSFVWAADEGEDAARWFSSVVGRAVRLLRADRTKRRALPEEYQRIGASNAVTGADGMPFLLASQASLDVLHDQAGLPRGTVPIDRYRANIEMSGKELGAFYEDRIRQLRIGRFIAFAVKPCARCPVPNVNQKTGERDNLSSKLMRYRTGWKVSADSASRPEQFFGQNLNHVWIENQYENKVTVSQGDIIEVMEFGEPNISLKTG